MWRVFRFERNCWENNNAFAFWAGTGPFLLDLKVFLVVEMDSNLEGFQEDNGKWECGGGRGEGCGTMKT